MLMVVATLLHPVVRPPQRSLPASRGWSRLMWFTRLLVAGAARPSRTLCGSAPRYGTVGVGGPFDRFLRHLSDRSDGELRFPRPGLGSAVTRGAGLHWPVLAGVDHQWVGGELFHDRLPAVRGRHDQDCDTASLVGVLVAVGAPAHLLGFGIAQLVSTAAWPIAILGSVSLGAGLAWPGYRLWRTPAGSDLLAANRSTQV
jgi:hypothetical protein